MNLGLLLPAGLLALLALAIPLLLHLVRQTEQTRIEFSALRWLVARAQPRRRPRFNEWLLLALRLLLLAVLALWLAQPVLFGHPDMRPWIVVDPAIDATRFPAGLPEDAQRRWLAPGFPALDQPAPRGTDSIASLLRELDATLPAGVALTAVVPEKFDATDAQRAVLGRPITWIAVPGRSAFSAASGPERMRIAVFVDDTHRRSLPYLRAAAAAWANQTKSPASTDTLRQIAGTDALSSGDTHVLWLADTAVPAQQRHWVRNGGVILLAQDSPAAALDWQDADVAWRGADGRPLALRLPDGNGAWLRMLVPFTPQSLPELLEPGFPAALKGVLQENSTIAVRARAESYTPAVDAHAKQSAPSSRSLDGLLALLIALLFGIERLLAMSMRRLRSA